MKLTKYDISDALEESLHLVLGVDEQGKSEIDRWATWFVNYHSYEALAEMCILAGIIIGRKFPEEDEPSLE